MSATADSQQQFNAWLADAINQAASALADASAIDAPSLVEYLSGILAADAANGEDADAQRETVRDIVQEFGLVSGDDEADRLAGSIVDAFSRMSVVVGGGGGASASSATSATVVELTPAEAEALAKVREMTVVKQQQHQSAANHQLVADSRELCDATEKQLILQAYANVSDSDGEGDCIRVAVGEGGPAINNRAAMESEERLKRERMRLEHASKQERDKADREKQRNAKEARKEAEKKRTQKQERRK